VKRILVVDDEFSTNALASDYLRLKGYEVVQCYDGESALKLLGDDRAFDLLVLDKRMPGMDGLDALRELRTDPKMASLPVILLSASVSPSQTAAEIGVSAFLSKPFSPKELAATVARLLP
jgi:CheY-like chemotaxis protein